MSDEERDATAQEDVAVGTIRDALVGPESLASRLRAGAGLDRRLVAQLLGDLGLLTTAWSARHSVPRRLAAAFVDVQVPLLHAAIAYDVAEQNAVEDAANEILDAVHALLEDEGASAEPGSPTGPDHVLHEGLVTANSLQYKLRMGRGLDQDQLSDLRAAFQTAICEYAGRSEIPKLVAAACVDLPSSMTQGLARYDPEQVARINAASAELTALARKLLQAEAQ
jgi:hypothetical protein